VSRAAGGYWWNRVEAKYRLNVRTWAVEATASMARSTGNRHDLALWALRRQPGVLAGA
jgi:hypothetical protein